MLRINQIALSLDSSEKELYSSVVSMLKVSRNDIKNFRIVKKSVDSRKKDNIFFVYAVDVDLGDLEDRILSKNLNKNISKVEYKSFNVPENKRKTNFRPVIAGFGPSGMFAGLTLARAGLRPIILERGADVDSRTRDVNNFWNTRVLNENSNVQFGEGGAGTFSDGKLNTGIKDPLCHHVLEEFVKHDAPEEILFNAKPHIGTDKLKIVVKNIRNTIISLGGEIHFNSKLTDIISYNNAIQGVTYVDENGNSFDLETDSLVLCVGHSARDTVSMLHSKGIKMMQKPFSIGARIEHKREMIDKAQYGKFANHPKLSAAEYKMACHPPNGRGAYTFCMCPGGTVVMASSENGGVVVNGMSEYSRDAENSNSALLVGINPEDFPSEHPLSGFDLQRRIENLAFTFGGSDYHAPCQLVGDFLNDNPSKKLGTISPSCPTGVTPTDLHRVLPKKVTDTLSGAIVKMNNQLKGFATKDAVLTGAETRSSSPVRILRDEFYQTNICGLFPCGEGAGYAGGIVSAAVDGIRCAFAVLNDES